MKSNSSAKSIASLFKHDSEQPVRLIKAAHAGKLLGNTGAHGQHAHPSGAEGPKKPEIRMIHTGPDFCDLEIICGCGESTQVRCWNAPASA